MKQYDDLCKRVINEGVWTENARTGIRTKTVINASFEFDVSNGNIEVVNTRKSPLKMPMAEITGYLKGLDNAQDFADIGSKTWFANANETQAWLDNPHRKGENDLGRLYGVQGRRWQKPDGSTVDQLAGLINNLERGVDSRGEILTFYNPGEFDMGALRPCLHSHQFSILGNDLYLTSTQRSADLPLGSVANAIQVQGYGGIDNKAIDEFLTPTGDLLSFYLNLFKAIK